MPLPRLVPKVWLRESGEEQVATRSPRPGESGEGERVGAHREAESGGLGEAARDERALGVVAEAHAVRDADGETDDVLDRAAQLAAHHVGVGVRAEVRRVAGGLEPLGDGLVGAGDHGRGRHPGGDLLGEVGPGDDGDPVRAHLGDVLDDLAHPHGGPSSTPFMRETRTVSGASSGVHSARLPRRVCEGTASTVKSASRGGLGGVRGGADGVREFDAREVVRVRARGVDRLGEFGAAGPQGDLAARVGEHHAEGGAP